MKPIIVLWAHMRARSTAFLRMMIERDDVYVIHEPLVTLLDHGQVDVPDGSGGIIKLKSEREFFAHLRQLSKTKTVFFKDTVEHRYNYLFDHPEDIANLVHTFIVRDPKQAISSIYKLKPNISNSQVGYEHLYEIFTQVEQISKNKPIVMEADRLVKDPEHVIKQFCKHAGIPFDPTALHWNAGTQPHWEKTQRWHEDVSYSQGFEDRDNFYEETIDNNQMLNGFYRYHYPFYKKLAALSV